MNMGSSSPLFFLRPKPDGSYRTILNLKTFNEVVQYHHFEMDTLESAIRIIKPDRNMVSIDLKDTEGFVWRETVSIYMLA